MEVLQYFNKYRKWGKEADTGSQLRKALSCGSRSEATLITVEGPAAGTAPQSRDTETPGTNSTCSAQPHCSPGKPNAEDYL